MGGNSTKPTPPAEKPASPRKDAPSPVVELNSPHRASVSNPPVSTIVAPSSPNRQKFASSNPIGPNTSVESAGGPSANHEIGNSNVHDSPYRSRLVAFYNKYNPEKLTGVDQILKQWRGEEEKLFTDLVRRYGPEPVSVINSTVSGATPAQNQGSPIVTTKKSNASSYVPPTVHRQANPVSPQQQQSASSPAQRHVGFKHSPNDANVWRDRYTRFFLHHDPSKVQFVDKLVAESHGHHEAVIRALVERFGPEPRIGNSTKPIPHPSTAETAEEIQQWKERYMRLLNHYHPNKALQVDRLMLLSKGMRERVMKALIKRCGPEPEAPPPGTSASKAAVVDHSKEQQKAATQFRRRLSGYLGIRAPSQLCKMVGRDDPSVPEADVILAFLSRSFGPEPSEDELRAYFANRLYSFYMVHEPKKAAGASAEMACRVGNEEDYMRYLVSLYGSDPAFGKFDALPPQAAAFATIPKTTDHSGSATLLSNRDSRSSSKWWESGARAVRQSEGGSERCVSEVMLCGSDPKSKFPVLAERETSGKSLNSGAENGDIVVPDRNVENNSINDMQVQKTTVSNLEAKELRRIACEQRELLLQHSAELEFLRHMLAASVSENCTTAAIDNFNQGSGPKGHYSAPHHPDAHMSMDQWQSPEAVRAVDAFFDMNSRFEPSDPNSHRATLNGANNAHIYGTDNGYRPTPHGSVSNTPRNSGYGGSFVSIPRGKSSEISKPEYVAPSGQSFSNSLNQTRTGSLVSMDDVIQLPEVELWAPPPPPHVYPAPARATKTPARNAEFDDDEYLMGILFSDPLPLPPPPLTSTSNGQQASRPSLFSRWTSPMKLKLRESTSKRKSYDENKNLDDLRLDYEANRADLSRQFVEDSQFAVY